MPWPPHPPRKYPDLTPQEARAKALLPYRFRPGDSGSPGGLTKSRKEQLAVCDEAALAMVPEAIVTLSELMRHSLDDRVRTRCAEILLERGLGKPRESPPPEAVEEIPHQPVRLVVNFVAAEHSPEPAYPIIDATTEPPAGKGTRAKAPAFSETVSDEVRIEQLERAIAEAQEQLEVARAGR